MKVNLQGSAIRINFKFQIDKDFGKGNFTKEEAKRCAEKAGLSETEFKSIVTHVLRHFKVDKNVYSFGDVPQEVKNEKKVQKKTLKKDWDIINKSFVETVAVGSSIAEVDKYLDNRKIAADAHAICDKPVVKESKKIPDTVVSLIPQKNPQYVSWGHFKDIKTILESHIFYPIFVTGLSGNGKTSMIHEVCAKLKRDLIRINITVETDEDDLLGGFRLRNGETIWEDGPLIVAMKTGAIALIDEVDLASHKIMCLQPIMEGQPIYLKKINEIVYPQKGFNIVATANTKGKGSEDGRFMGTNILNEAFLDRFSATFYQEYPAPAQEARILKKQFQMYEIEEDGFVDNLVKWADVIRQSFKQGAVDDIITTRRLIDITKTFSIFRDKMKSIVLCLERFDDETRESFVDFYTKVDAGVSMDDLLNDKADFEAVIEEEDEEDNVPF